MRRSITILLLLVLVLMEVKAQVLPFRLSKGAGTFRLGIVAGDESRWLDECSLKKTGDRIYIIKDALLEKGEVRLVICPLADTKGFVMEVSGSRLPQNISLCWAFGACNEDETLSREGNVISPGACRDNVFSDEENAVTVYYGKSMGLRVTSGIMPIVLNFACRMPISRKLHLNCIIRERKQMLLYFPVSTPGLRKRIVTSVSINRTPRRIIITLCYRNYF